jgi:hypothetical protein
VEIIGFNVLLHNADLIEIVDLFKIVSVIDYRIVTCSGTFEVRINSNGMINVILDIVKSVECIGSTAKFVVGDLMFRGIEQFVSLYVVDG